MKYFYFFLIGLLFLIPIFLGAFENEIFQACGKEWKLGPLDLNWDATQSWTKNLGEDWRSPTMVELSELYKEIGERSPINGSSVWAEPKDPSSAWFFSFSHGIEDFANRNYQFKGGRAECDRIFFRENDKNGIALHAGWIN